MNPYDDYQTPLASRYASKFAITFRFIFARMRMCD